MKEGIGKSQQQKMGEQTGNRQLMVSSVNGEMETQKIAKLSFSTY